MPTNQAATDKQPTYDETAFRGRTLVDALKAIQEKLSRGENAEACEIAKGAEAIARRIATKPNEGHEHCQACGNLIRDRGEVVGHHLSDCKADGAKVEEPAHEEPADVTAPITYERVPADFRDAVRNFLEEVHEEIESARQVATVARLAVQGMNTDHSEEIATVICFQIDDKLFAQRERVESMLKTIAAQPTSPSK